MKKVLLFLSAVFLLSCNTTSKLKFQFLGCSWSFPESYKLMKSINNTIYTYSSSDGTLRGEKTLRVFYYEEGTPATKDGISEATSLIFDIKNKTLPGGLIQSKLTLKGVTEKYESSIEGVSLGKIYYYLYSPRHRKGFMMGDVAPENFLVGCGVENETAGKRDSHRLKNK